jgi:urease accessory protein
MLIFTQRLANPVEDKVYDTLSLDAEARSRPRQHLALDKGDPCYLRLPRGTVLQDGDYLVSENEETMVRVVAKPEPVITVKANQTENLVKAAYHLGNRHVSLEIASDYLRFSPDPVLEDMLKQMGLRVIQEVAPFFPEVGAYHHHH